MSLDLPRGQHVSQDQWDGYAAERKEILEHFLSKGVSNLVALTGDIHTFLAGDMTTTGNWTASRSASSWSPGRPPRSASPSSSGCRRRLCSGFRAAADPHIKLR